MFVVLLVIPLSAAASSNDQSNNLQFTEVIPDPDSTIQPANMTEDDTAESSGDTDCTCSDITCNNCGLVYNHTNLLPNATAIQFFEQVESVDEEGKMYLEIHFCQW